MTRNDLISLAEESVNISEQGSYLLGGKTVQLYDMGDSVLYLNGEANMRGLSFTVYDNPVVEVKEEGTVDALLRLNSCISSSDAVKLGVLNFASAYHPGGGFLGGAMAQEECLAYCSDLYYKQTEQKVAGYYLQNKALKTKMYSDAMIFSGVNFFRDGYFNLLEEVVMGSVLTVPAVNMSAVKQNKESVAEANICMKNRMEKAIKMFIANGCNYVILGAFGCGVFGNDPEIVAKNWYDILYNKGYLKYFKYVCFSILDGRGRVSNLKPFLNQF